MCDYEKCRTPNRPIFIKGLCDGCYMRLHRTRTLAYRCIIRGCKNEAVIKKMCQECYDVRHHELRTLWGYFRKRSTYDPSWDDFRVFLNDVGERPSKQHSFRKQNEDEPYSKDNFYWRDSGEYPALTLEYERNWQLKRVFGITLTEYNNMLKAQKGVCAICKRPETQVHGVHKKVRQLCVDHDHLTGNIRGLLCSGCNSTLGRINDSIPILYAAIVYLKSYL